MMDNRLCGQPGPWSPHDPGQYANRLRHDHALDAVRFEPAWTTSWWEKNLVITDTVGVNSRGFWWRWKEHHPNECLLRLSLRSERLHIISSASIIIVRLHQNSLYVMHPQTIDDKCGSAEILITTYANETPLIRHIHHVSACNATHPQHHARRRIASFLRHT